MLEQVFKLGENRTNVRTEVVAGITTFLTMAYIIFVNPSILAEAKMPFGAVFAATCIAAAVGCFLMAFLANYPIALAPGMGLNAYGAITGFGLLVASLMWLIHRWHKSNLSRYPDELKRLLDIARHDKSH